MKQRYSFREASVLVLAVWLSLLGSASGAPNVVAWGYSSRNLTNVPPTLTNAVAVAGGPYCSVALTRDGTVVVWGDNTYHQLEIPVSATNIVAIAAETQCLALRNDGAIIAWGDNAAGKATPPSGLTNVVAVAAALTHSLALLPDGRVVAWGSSSFGSTNVPVNLTNAVAIACSGQHSLALRADGTVVAWGDNFLGATNVPVGLTNATAIAAGLDFCIALRDDGRLAKWGFFGWQVSDITNVVGIAAGVSQVLALYPDGTVLDRGQAGPPAGLTNVFALAANLQSLAAVGNGPPLLRAFLVNPTLSAEGFNVSLPTRSGRVYRLEYKASLAEAQWTPLPLVAGNGGMRNLTDPTAMGVQRYYRVREW